MHPTVNGPTAAGEPPTGGSQPVPVTGTSTTGSNSGGRRGSGPQSQQMPLQQFNQPPHQLPLENGIDFRHSSSSTIVTAAHTSVGSQPNR